MAIVKMSKFQLTLFTGEKEKLLKRLQQFNDVHFRDLSRQEELVKLGVKRPDTGKRHSAHAEQSKRMEEAIHILEGYREAPKSLIDKFSTVLPELSRDQLAAIMRDRDPKKLAEETLRLDQRIRKEKERIQSIREKKEELSRWKKLDLPLEWISSLKKVDVLLGTIPARWEEDLKHYVATEAEGVYVEAISRDDRFSYLMILTDRRDQKLAGLLKDINFLPVDLGKEGQISERLEAYDRELLEADKQISESRLALKQEAAQSLEAIQYGYEKLANEEKVVSAEDRFLETEYLSFLEGYVPSARESEFFNVVRDTLSEGRYELEMKEADSEDPEVPILLHNNKLVEPFENIIRTYALPKYNEMDPTPIMMPWYLIFFGMMMGDLGYGLVMLLATTLVLKFIPMKKSTTMSIRFFRLLSIPTIIAGILFGSCFSGLIPMPFYVIDPTKSYMEMIAISVVVGFVNIIFGLGVLAWKNIRDGKPMDAIYDVVSWYLILFGAPLMGAQMFGLPPIWKTIGTGMLILGALGVVFFSARDEKTPVARVAWGFYNLYGATSYVGDIVSYTRIAALLLSGAYIGFAVNLIGQMIFGLGVPGFILGGIILIVFHAFNLFLSGLSGYVHSMRLIYVEFFGKFYEGGGVPFEPLQADAKYVKTDSGK